MQDYRRFRVWRHAHALVLRVHAVAARTRWRGHPSLRNQIVRAAESIAANIVEGCCRSTQRELARFLYIAAGSCSELEYHLRLARDLHLITEDVWHSLRDELQAVRKMLFGLLRRVKQSIATSGTNPNPPRLQSPGTGNVGQTENTKRPEVAHPEPNPTSSAEPV